MEWRGVPPQKGLQRTRRPVAVAGAVMGAYGRGMGEGGRAAGHGRVYGVGGTQRPRLCARRGGASVYDKRARVMDCSSLRLRV